MAKKSRKSMLEMDRGSGRPGTSVAATTPVGEFSEREADRQGLRELDQLTEASTRLSRAQKDRERILPRAASQSLNPATRSRVPEFDEIRTPISGRQMKERSKLKRQQQAKWTAAQRREMVALFAGEGESTWSHLGDQLSTHLGDPDALSVRDRRSVQRIDRAIRQHEEGNDRQHHLYANAQLPPGFNAAELKKYEALHLDRWTAGSHNLHEISGDDDDMHVLEITTRRGMYLGHSDGGANASHLLPRGMSFTVTEVYQARWHDKHGNSGVRNVIRLQEIDEKEGSPT